LGDETLVALMDDELEQPARDRAERHLGHCGRCVRRLARQERAEAALRAALGAPELELVPAPASPRRVGTFIAGAGVLLGSAGALTLAGLAVRHYHHRAGA
jgi:anti-sigma factor RsiW